MKHAPCQFMVACREAGYQPFEETAPWLCSIFVHQIRRLGDHAGAKKAARLLTGAALFVG